MSVDADIDPERFATHTFDGRGFRQAYVREGAGGVPLLLVHGWPESKRIWWRVIQPLAEAGFDVIVPDLRGFGDSDLGPDGFHDVPAHVRDLHALLVDGLGVERVVLCGGDLGGPVVQMLALEHPDLTERLVLFNSPLPFDKERMAGMATRPPAEAADYFVRQGMDADGLAADLATAAQRRRYIATFYTSRFWAHPGAFMGDARFVFGPFGGTPQVDFHTEPFGDAAKLRASFGGYESVFDPSRQSEPARLERNESVSARSSVRPVGPRDLPGLRRDGRDRVPRPRRSPPPRCVRPLRSVGGRGCAHPAPRALLPRPSRVTQVPKEPSR